MNQKPSRSCLQCGDPVKGRADKKYCSEDCRTEYNNKLNRDANNFVAKINRILRRNRRILAALNPNGKAKVKKERMQTAGFHFGYYTNIYETKSGNIYKFVYDQGYIQLDEQTFALVVRQAYVD